MYRSIYLWSSPVPVLNHIAVKNIWSVISPQHHCLGKNDDPVQTNIRKMKTFLCQLFRGPNNNQFFQNFGLLHDLFYCQDLSNTWSKRRLKRLTIFLSIFGKRYFARLILLFEFPRQLWKDYGTFRLSVISISCIRVWSSVRRFLSAAFI